MSGLSKTPDHVVLICTKCRGNDAASKLRSVLSDRLPSGFVIRAVDCMAGCDYPGTVGFQAPGKATYLFGDIESRASIQAIAEFASQYQQSTNGWTSASERPADLYDKTLARLPALKSVGVS